MILLRVFLSHQLPSAVKDAPDVSSFRRLLSTVGYILPAVNTVIDHFTLVCLATWPLNGSEAGGDLVLIKTSLVVLCNSSFSCAK